MKNKKKNKNQLDDMDVFLYEIAKKDLKPIPKEIQDNIQKTIDSLDFEPKVPARTKVKVPLRYRFKEKLGTIITKPAHAVIASFLIVMLVATGAVGARQMSEKFFGKDTVRLTDIGIANEFTFTKEMEML